MNYIKKFDFYNKISDLRHQWGFDDDFHRIDFVALCKQKGIEVGTVPFFTSGLRGMASLGSGNQKDVIVLNTARNMFEQNVDCAHEFIHINFHRDEGYQSFKCFDKAQPNQDKYLEWQANEGGAELVVPYRSILPKIKKSYHYLNTYTNISCFKDELVQEYGVTDAVISYRLESLKYEIAQYVNGVSMKDIKILSQSSQAKQGINIKSLNAIAFEDLSNNFGAIYDLTESEWNTYVIIREWENILLDLGGVIKASLCDTILKLNCNNCFSIIFKNYNNYLIGKRPVILSQLEDYVSNKYGEEVHFKAHLEEGSPFFINNHNWG